MAKVTVTGFDQLRAQLLSKIPASVKTEVQASLEKSGAEMVAMAKALAPVDEGELRASITMTKAGENTPIYSSGGRRAVGDLAVRVTAGDWYVRYAFLVEHGTLKMAARPFFWPSYRILRSRFRGRNTRALNAAFKKATR